MGRTPCCDKNGLKKGPWRPEEDQKLVDYIQEHGYGNWRTLPKNAGLQRCGKSCRLRWTNYLRPDIKRGRFTFEEEETIIQLHSILGNKWSAIADRLPGRTDNEIKNYWNTHIRKRLLRMGIDPVTHSPRLDLLDLSSILGSSSLYNSNSQMNLSRLLGIQPFVNPELLRLATSNFVTSQQCDQNLNLLLPNNVPEMQYQIHQAPIQEHFISDQNLQVNNEWQNNNGVASNYSQDYVPAAVTSYDYYGYDGHVVDPSSETSNLIYDNVNYPNFNMTSVLSTPSSSPTQLNSNSTYINSSAEDEKESYCSDMLKIEIPDIFDINQFMYMSETN